MVSKQPSEWLIEKTDNFQETTLNTLQNLPCTKKTKKKTAHTRWGSIAMGPHGGAAKTAHRKERSIVP